jgi:hypothetical protein
MPGHSTELQQAINNTNDRIDCVEDDIERIECDLLNVLNMLHDIKGRDARILRRTARRMRFVYGKRLI